MMWVGGRGASVAEKLWRLAIVTAGALGTIAEAQASQRYWSESDPGISLPDHAFSTRKHRSRHANEASEKQAAKPLGPLVIAISIQAQKLRVYDANGLFAETPVSTGMSGHSTPMGVFSVIQKQKLHHSNIYSGAPMPYMQRITWSGVAMHAGGLPGYPASHGCIRMPMAFAVKMWNWTRMGARVIVTPGEISPASFVHPLLAAQKVPPQSSAVAEPPAGAPPAVAADKAANLELRTTVGHRDGVKVADATPSVIGSPPREQALVRTDAGPSVSADAVSLMAADAANAVEKSDSTKAEIARPAAEPVTAQTGVMPSSEDKPLARSRSEAVASEARPAGIDAPEKSGSNLDAPATASAKIESKSDEPTVEAHPADAKIKASKPAAAMASETPDAIKADSGSGVLDLKNDPLRLPDADKPAAAKPDPAKAAAPKRSGQIAVFVSRKDSKLYVRQNFEPLFDVPVTIAAGDRPLGTHVFTAQIDKNDANLVHWSVVSLPVSRHAADERSSRRRKSPGAAEINEKPQPDSPAEALDRLTIPKDAMARITEALSTGTSIIVSDQGINAGETGEGTDFIVSLR